MLIDHVPQGNPCKRCGESAFRHRVEHLPLGDPCQECGLAASRHRVRQRSQISKLETRYLGVDGEGIGRKDHKYVLLVAASEAGQPWWVEDYNGLSTVTCLDFLLSIPQHNTKVFAYSFNYDMTKILTDLSEKLLYLLFRPELRQRFGIEALKGPKPIRWNGYTLNLQGTKFTIAKGPRYRVIWDIWKFYQSKFVNALKDWKVGSPELWERMSEMKDNRSEFDKLSKTDGGKLRIRNYAIEECQCMATLAHRLVDAHEAAGLKLRSFYGAGSTAAAMLKKMGIKEKIKPTPKDMQHAVASAFFGGRFENSVIGPIQGPIYNYDISSAYPYHLCFLPCLLHGEWELTTSRYYLKTAKAALVNYALPASKSNPRIKQWGPFPFRTSEGSISFPITSGGGWVWRDEFLAGERLFPQIEFKQAWIYYSTCDCVPFTDISKYYLERLRIGKEGPGIVIKLGMNSNYGKLAQSIGKGQFNSWIWAGMITSNTRAQILELLGLHQDDANLLMIATDGIQTRERLKPPKPRNTDTDVDIYEAKTGLLRIVLNCNACKHTESTLDCQRCPECHSEDIQKRAERKPLGGWEEDIVNQGVFYARPGIYFPLNPTKKQIKKIRGRGVGKGVILENHKLILDSWNRYGVHEPVKVANVSRFCGAKSSVHRSGHAERPTFHRADGTQPTEPGKQAPAYGQWITRSVEMSFNPLPKRECVSPDGVSLQLRSFPEDVTSMPYKKAVRSFEAIQLAEATLEMLEQPDADLIDYEDVPPQE